MQILSERDKTKQRSDKAEAAWCCASAFAAEHQLIAYSTDVPTDIFPLFRISTY